MREQPQAPSLRIAAPAPRASRHGSAQGSGRPQRWVKRTPKKQGGKKSVSIKKNRASSRFSWSSPEGVPANPSGPGYNQSTRPAACPLREQPAPPARAAPAAAAPAPARPRAERPARPVASPALPPIGPAPPGAAGSSPAADGAALRTLPVPVPVPVLVRFFRAGVDLHV